jgi:hypothetical protein
MLPAPASSSDRDTGDAAGDIFFTLYEAILPVYCPVRKEAILPVIVLCLTQLFPGESD